MPSSGDTVSLVPRSSKKTLKKHRPGFRPVAKAKVGSSKKKNKVVSSREPEDVDLLKTREEEAETEPSSDEVAAVAPAELNKSIAADSTQNIEEFAAGGATELTGEMIITEKTQEDPAYAINRATRSGEVPVSTGRKRGQVDAPTSPSPKSGAFNEKTKADANTARSSSLTPKEVAFNIAADAVSTASAPAASSSPRRSSRKRKHTVHNSIRVGSSQEVDVAPSSPTVQRESETSRKEKEQNAAMAASASAVAAAAAAACTSTTLVPIFSQDEATLERLGSENASGPTLSAFCSTFKIEKDVSEKGRGKRRKKNQDNPQNDDATEHGNPNAAGPIADKEVVEPMEDADMSVLQQAPAGVPVVQIIDGEIVLQESSLMLPTRRTVQEVEEEFQDVVEEDAHPSIIQASYTSFLTKGDAATNGGKRGPQHWSLEETQNFYGALRQLGTDFGLMEALFDGKRTRRQLKNKYIKEIRKNPNLVREIALNPKYKTGMDMTVFNVEVDPKRIEAHENEEPPPYEPTDVEETQPEAPEEQTAAAEGVRESDIQQEGEASFARDQEPHSKGIEEELEVIYEDAREEAAAAAAEAASESQPSTPKRKKSQYRPNNNSRMKTNRSPEKTSKAIGQHSLWPAVSDGDILVAEREGPDRFADEDIGEPSMEDFFEDQMAGAPPLEEVSEMEETIGCDSNTKNDITSSEVSHLGSEKNERVSLVPKKRATSKNRRPKIRPSVRKKKGK